MNQNQLMMKPAAQTTISGTAKVITTPRFREPMPEIMRKSVAVPWMRWTVPRSTYLSAPVLFSRVLTIRPAIRDRQNSGMETL